MVASVEEEGSTTIWFAAVTAALMSLGLALVVVVGVWAQKAQTQAVADFAALAGASQSAVNTLPGIDTQGACGLAARVVEANSSRIQDCWEKGGDTYVIAETDRTFGVFPVTVTARARAGPAG